MFTVHCKKFTRCTGLYCLELSFIMDHTKQKVVHVIPYDPLLILNVELISTKLYFIHIHIHHVHTCILFKANGKTVIIVLSMIEHKMKL